MVPTGTNFDLSPLSPSPFLLSVSIKKQKVSVAARQSVHPSERSPTLPSSSGLCVRQIENEQLSTVGEVSEPLKVMALASRRAGPDYAVSSLPGSDSWLSKKKQKNPELVPARLGAVKLHFRCCRNILDLVLNKHASITVGLATCLWLCSTVSTVRSTQSIYSRSLAIGMTCDSDVMEKPSRRWRGAVQQLADVVWESPFSSDYHCSRNRESNFFLTGLLTFFCSLRLKIV